MKAMKDSISEVLETMFYLSIEINEEIQKETIEVLDSNSCKLSFKGPFTGYFYTSCPEALLRKMTINFLGVDEEEITNSHMQEMVKEMANIVAGNMFCKLDVNSEYKLGIPETITENISFSEENTDKQVNIYAETFDNLIGFKVKIQ
ncbi:MAG: chemotaxis protein CheX [Proteobacteria bacterium]|nr:chemotaxis protein CheX [Pseudomonadota bacterium]